MEAAINDRTRLLISESPTNPHLSVVDLERFVAAGTQVRRRDDDRRHAGHALNLRPLDYGVDYVLHSCTKYLAGHNDMLGGVVIGSAEKLAAVAQAARRAGQPDGGRTPSTCCSVGLRRSNYACSGTTRTAMAVAEFLDVAPASGEGLLSRPAEPPRLRDRPPHACEGSAD